MERREDIHAHQRELQGTGEIADETKCIGTKNPGTESLGFFLATAVEEIRCRECGVVLIPLVLNLQMVRKREKLEASLLVESHEFTATPVVVKVPSSQILFHSYGCFYFI